MAQSLRQPQLDQLWTVYRHVTLAAVALTPVALAAGCAVGFGAVVFWFNIGAYLTRRWIKRDDPADSL